jgi:hypothetical protein
LQFFLGEPSLMAPAYRFQSTALGFALGLYLVREAVRVLQQKPSKGMEWETLREHFPTLLESVMAFDRTADQLLAAITVACLEPTVKPVVPALFIALFIGLQNRPEDLKRELPDLAGEAPGPFFAPRRRCQSC